MHRRSALICLVLGAAGLLPAPAWAQAQPCPVGQRVVDRSGARGVVIAEPSRGNCTVRWDDGRTGNLPAWLLSPEEGRGPAAPAGLTEGTYVCTATGAGFFRIAIRGGQYVDGSGNRGAYKYDPGQRSIVFTGGPLAGQYSRLLGPGKFGLSTGPASNFYAVCNLS